MAWRASTRPRMTGSARIWTMAVDVTMKVMLAKPMTTAIGYGEGQRRRRREQRASAAPKAKAPRPRGGRGLVAPRHGQRAGQRPDADDRQQQR